MSPRGAPPLEAKCARPYGWGRLCGIRVGWPAGVRRLARRSLGPVGHYHGVRHTPVLFNPIQSTLTNSSYSVIYTVNHEGS